ncbi:dickkopf-related protein 3-like [Hydractinia symbiolongicarpus]|uniref:dickkopf-related protein 3-like n=1 Tax=Hydractinia symbiolongicarpus TaxID=13093 RepID=UPI00254EBC83|nr:dickkopf-related protein 3-like [Hydractinia symbiolongicarpus]
MYLYTTRVLFTALFYVWCCNTSLGFYRIVETRYPNGTGYGRIDREEIIIQNTNDKDVSKTTKADNGEIVTTYSLEKLNPGIRIFRRQQGLLKQTKRRMKKRRRCQADKDCSGVKRCNRYNRLCERCRIFNELCRRDANCCAGRKCMWGRCRNAKHDGTEMSICRHDRNCSKGYCCAREHGQSVCKKFLAENESCERTAGGLMFSIHHSCPCRRGLYCKKKPKTSGRICMR